MEPIKKLINDRQNLLENDSNLSDDNVTNVNNNYSNNVKRCEVDSIAHELAEKLDAPQNLNFYRKIVWRNKPEFLYRCLTATLSKDKEGQIRTSKAQYFNGVFRNLTRVYNKN